MNSTSIIPRALFSAVLRSGGLCLLVEGFVALTLTFTPWGTDRIALLVRRYHATSIGDIRIAFIFFNILPGMFLLYAGRGISTFFTGKISEKELFETQERSLFCVGIAVFGIWKFVFGLSHIASVVVWKTWNLFEEPGYSLSSQDGIVGVTNIIVGITNILVGTLTVILFLGIRKRSATQSNST